MLLDCAYPGYVYGYPHKKAYRPLPSPQPLADAWSEEDRRHLFCYVHIPFCNQRCSFCNLFTYVPTDASPARCYLEALSLVMAAYEKALSPCRFTRLYIGGGTPTWLDTSELKQLMRTLCQTLAIDPAATQGCIEASPETIDDQKVEFLLESGFQRLSLGVQSLVEEELRQVNRRFDFDLHERSINLIVKAGFPHINNDLIYGLPGQTRVELGLVARASYRQPGDELVPLPALHQALDRPGRQAAGRVAQHRDQPLRLLIRWRRCTTTPSIGSSAAGFVN